MQQTCHLRLHVPFIAHVQHQKPYLLSSASSPKFCRNWGIQAYSSKHVFVQTSEYIRLQIKKLLVIFASIRRRCKGGLHLM